MSEASPGAGRRGGLACITEPALRDLTAPQSLNSGSLEDVYKLRVDDFEEPQTLEVQYSDGRGNVLREIVFVDPVYSDKRPRICVSIDGIQAMHNAIAVLSRKVDNLVATLKNCRSAYYKELIALREQLHQQALAIQSGKDYNLRDTTMFDKTEWDIRSSMEVDRRVKEATADLETKLSCSADEIKRLEKRIHIVERESGRIFAARVKEGGKDPREMITDLVALINVDTLLRTAKQAMGEKQEAEFWEVLEGMVSDHLGFNVSEASQSLDAERKKRVNAELELSKATDYRDLQAQLAATKSDLEAEQQRVAKLLSEKEKPEPKLTGSKGVLQDINRLKGRVQALGEKADKDFWEALETIVGDHRGFNIAEAAHQLEDKKRKTQIEADLNKAHANDLREMQTQLLALRRELEMERDRATKIVAEKGIADQSMMITSSKDLNDVIQMKQLVEAWDSKRHASFSETVVKALQPKAVQSLAAEVVKLDTVKLPSAARATVICGLVGGVAEEDLKPVMTGLPSAARKFAAVEAINALAAAEEAADNQKHKRPAAGTEEAAAAEAALQAAAGLGTFSIDLGRDLSKKARWWLTVKLMKHLKGEEVRALADKIGEKSRKAMLTAIFEDQDPAELTRSASMITANVSLQALANGFSEAAGEKLASLLLARLGDDAMQRLVGNSQPSASPGRRANMSIAVSRSTMHSNTRMEVVDIDDKGTQTSITGTDVPLGIQRDPRRKRTNQRNGSPSLGSSGSKRRSDLAVPREDRSNARKPSPTPLQAEHHWLLDKKGNPASMDAQAAIVALRAAMASDPPDLEGIRQALWIAQAAGLSDPDVSSRPITAEQRAANAAAEEEEEEGGSDEEDGSSSGSRSSSGISDEESEGGSYRRRRGGGSAPGSAPKEAGEGRKTQVQVVGIPVNAMGAEGREGSWPPQGNLEAGTGGSSRPSTKPRSSRRSGRKTRDPDSLWVEAGGAHPPRQVELADQETQTVIIVAAKDEEQLRWQKHFVLDRGDPELADGVERELFNLARGLVGPGAGGLAMGIGHAAGLMGSPKTASFRSVAYASGRLGSAVGSGSSRPVSLQGSPPQTAGTMGSSGSRSSLMPGRKPNDTMAAAAGFVPGRDWGAGDGGGAAAPPPLPLPSASGGAARSGTAGSQRMGTAPFTPGQDGEGFTSIFDVAPPLPPLPGSAGSARGAHAMPGIPSHDSGTTSPGFLEPEEPTISIGASVAISLARRMSLASSFAKAAEAASAQHEVELANRRKSYQPGSLLSARPSLVSNIVQDTKILGALAAGFKDDDEDGSEQQESAAATDTDTERTATAVGGSRRVSRRSSREPDQATGLRGSDDDSSENQDPDDAFSPHSDRDRERRRSAKMRQTDPDEDPSGSYNERNQERERRRTTKIREPEPEDEEVYDPYDQYREQRRRTTKIRRSESKESGTAPGDRRNTAGRRRRPGSQRARGSTVVRQGDREPQWDGPLDIQVGSASGGHVAGKGGTRPIKPMGRLSTQPTGPIQEEAEGPPQLGVLVGQSTGPPSLGVGTIQMPRREEGGERPRRVGTANRLRRAGSKSASSTGDLHESIAGLSIGDGFGVNGLGGTLQATSSAVSLPQLPGRPLGISSTTPRLRPAVGGLRQAPFAGPAGGGMVKLEVEGARASGVAQEPAATPRTSAATGQPRGRGTVRGSLQPEGLPAVGPLPSARGQSFHQVGHHPSTAPLLGEHGPPSAGGSEGGIAPLGTAPAGVQLPPLRGAANGEPRAPQTARESKTPWYTNMAAGRADRTTVMSARGPATQYQQQQQQGPQAPPHHLQQQAQLGQQRSAPLSRESMGVRSQGSVAMVLEHAPVSQVFAEKLQARQTLQLRPFAEPQPQEDWDEESETESQRPQSHQQEEVPSWMAVQGQRYTTALTVAGLKMPGRQPSAAQLLQPAAVSPVPEDESPVADESLSPANRPALVIEAIRPPPEEEHHRVLAPRKPPAAAADPQAPARPGSGAGDAASVVTARVQQQLEDAYGSVGAAWAAIQAKGGDGGGALSRMMLQQHLIEAGVAADDAMMFIQAMLRAQGASGESSPASPDRRERRDSSRREASPKLRLDDVRAALLLPPSGPSSNSPSPHPSVAGRRSPIGGHSPRPHGPRVWEDGVVDSTINVHKVPNGISHRDARTILEGDTSCRRQSGTTSR